MPISAGDVVLTFTADMTQLDAAFNKVANETAAKLTPATTALSGIGAAATQAGKAGADAGTSLADAWQLIPPVVQKTDSQLEAMAFSLRNIAPVADESFERVSSQSRHAAAEVSELGRGIGFVLPRSVRAFLLELPGVAGAMEAAFSVLSIILLIDIVAKVIEKLVQWREEAHKIELAQTDFQTAILNSFHSLDEKLLQSGIKLDELRGNHLAALKKELELINLQSFKELEGELANLAKIADAVFKELEGHWFLLDFGSKGAQNALQDFRAQYELLLAQGKGDKADQLLEGTLDSAKKTLVILQNSKKEADEIRQLGEQTGRGVSILGPAGATEKEIKSQEALIAVLEAQVKARQKVADDTQNKTDIKTGEEAHKVADLQIAEAQRVEKAELAEIEFTRSQYQLYYEQRRIGASTLAVVEVKSANDARKAHEAYLEKVISEYKKAGESVKAKAAEEELATFKIHSAAQAVESLTKATHSAAEETKKWEKASYETVLQMEKVGEVEITAPLSKIAKNALDLNADLKRLNVEGWIPLRLQIAAAADAEKKLHAAGIHDGKLWLQVQAAKLKATIALEQAAGRSALKEIAELRKVEVQLKEFSDVAYKAMQNFITDLGDGFAAAIQGQESYAQAFEQSIGKMIASVAKYWADYFAALAIADMWFNPAKAAAELAAAVALETIAGVAGALGGGSNSSSNSTGASSSSSASIDSGSSANHPAQQPVSTTNIAHLGNGGLVDRPMMAEIGHGREVVLPLDNESVMQAFREGIGANGPITVIVEGIPLHKLSRRMSSDQKKGKYRVHSTSSARTIRQY